MEFHDLDELEVLEGFHNKYDQLTDISQLLNIRRSEATVWSFEDLSEILDQLSSLSIIFGVKDPPSQCENIILPVRKLLLCRYIQHLALWDPVENFPRYEPELCPNVVSLT